jgi:hypothetical protein
MNISRQQFTDEFFNLHLQDKLLGQGGQGAVYRTMDPDLALKLVTSEHGEPVTDPRQMERYYTRLAKLRLLPVPCDLNLCVPMALLKDRAGYVMQLLSGMAPFSLLLPDAKAAQTIRSGEFPKWLGGLSEELAQRILHYRDTGGIRRRLTALYKCASILAQLHGNGFVYGDVSPNNVFLSEDPSHSEVWLIDADNLRFETCAGGSAVYTPKYGAPEIVQGLGGGRPRCDCHAFAVMAFQMLAMIHPFIGNLVEGGDTDWAESLDDAGDAESRAFAGVLPWVDDDGDDSNASQSGLPRPLVMTPRLQTLFQQTFGAGRTCFWKRPAIYHWPQVLAEAGDRTIICHSCGMSWFFDVSGGHCPYCNARKEPWLLVRSFRWNGANSLDEPCWTFSRELPETGQVVVLPERVFAPFLMKTSDDAVLQILLDRSGVVLSTSENCILRLSVAQAAVADGKFKEFHSQIRLPEHAARDGFWIYAEGAEPRLLNCKIVGSANES